MALPDWIKNAKPGPNMRLPYEPGPPDEENYRRYLAREYQGFVSEGLKIAAELRSKIPNFDTPKTFTQWKAAFGDGFLKGGFDGITSELLGIKPDEKVSFQQILDQMYKVQMGLPLNSDIGTTDDKQKTALLLLIVLAVFLSILKRRK
jgi:hypothetical protein